MRDARTTNIWSTKFLIALAQCVRQEHSNVAASVLCSLNGKFGIMRKLLVIGGSGFIGRHLIRRRMAEGGWKIVSVDIREPLVPIDGVEYINHDVRDLCTLQNHDDVDTIYNLAAVHTTPGHEFWEYFDTNVRGATEVIKFSNRHSIRNIVFTSSISVYGPSENEKNEASTPNPNSAYGWSKLLAEGVFRSWYEATSDARLLIVRPAVVFGEGEGGNFTRLAKLMARGWFIYPGRRDTVKACIYVKDLLDYIDAMWEKEDTFSLFNGCYAERYELQLIVGEFKRHFPNVREITIPSAAMVVAARALMTLPNGIGIHPDRITKLNNSTNIYPKVLVDNGISKHDPLCQALQDWNDETDGSFT